MKIVLFVNSLKTFYWHRQALASQLMREGHEVLIITSKDEEIRRTNIAFNFQFIDLSRKGINPLKELRSVFSVLKIFLNFKPDIIHNFTVKCVIYGSLASLFVTDTKVINSITGLGSAFIKENFLSTFIRFLYRVVFKLSKSSVIFQNDDDIEYFRKYNILPMNRIFLIKGSGVDLERFAFQEPVNSSTVKILFASRLLKDKGIGELINAAKILKSKNLNFEMIVAGDVDPGNPSSLSIEEFRGLIKGLPIKWVGQVNDVLALMTDAQVVCLPSYREGTPMILLEAAACGKAIVATNVPGCRNVVIHETTGLLAEVRNEADLADKLEKFLIDKDLRSNLGKNARKHVEENFGRNKILSEILKTYGQ